MDDVPTERPCKGVDEGTGKYYKNVWTRTTRNEFFEVNVVRQELLVVPCTEKEDFGRACSGIFVIHQTCVCQ